MEQNMKQIPFDIERAKRIQAGEEPGEIVTLYGDAVRIICWDMKGDRYFIVGLVMNEDREFVDYYTAKGESVKDRRLSNDLVLRVPCTEEYEFEPFQKVLVRDAGDAWRCEFYSHRIEDKTSPFVCMGYTYEHCIPYNEETKHLLGTTDNWEG